MPRKINITPRARADMQNIWLYTAQHWSEDQADKYIGRLYNKLQILSENPLLGKHRKDIAHDYYCSPNQEHLIFYLIREQSIDIIGVPHQQMDIVRYFEN
ncbi:type II toxin-antitoxin system RelE/ParE family toxin [Paraneptunicella aestuarii]|uniref:type II toxin-antitoxin system RelE/ParE family toxin n=1 Tax=Paraneptunicella aestuarii TaxID=2831148 RepID=UPI001E588950|nr:type II toxin-antitoxin system RelE/ParE family toxin [Paraneptunicella aestuarii]UAA39806.1 type II toxin-antitoxin system RelE/ParE family toxin [Paraneptunicella aestuarii]